MKQKLRLQMLHSEKLTVCLLTAAVTLTTLADGPEMTALPKRFRITHMT
jgi:hypothetical protein